MIVKTYLAAPPRSPSSAPLILDPGSCPRRSHLLLNLSDDNDGNGFKMMRVVWRWSQTLNFTVMIIMMMVMMICQDTGDNKQWWWRWVLRLTAAIRKLLRIEEFWREVASLWWRVRWWGCPGSPPASSSSSRASSPVSLWEVSRLLWRRCSGSVWSRYLKPTYSEDGRPV